ncbi:MAG TPA: nucleotidyltransferase domain-containing protein [Anaerolineae bacterium]|nr:nucleotidyltransferase domain-containing protein [Anaerolineae bacterium]HQI83614.1 nucleotidyltransferase domain-containing protein [Anaerolineae bacterium]
MTGAEETLTRRENQQQQRAQRARALRQEAERLAQTAAELGVQQVVLFGSLARGIPALTSDVDLLIVWDTPLDFVTRTVEIYQQLQPREAVDLLVYTPDEMTRMADRPFIRNALREGTVLYEIGS